MGPADQRFEADEFARRQVEQRLIIQRELALLQRPDHVHFQVPALDRILHHAAFVALDAVAAVLLGLVEGKVRLTHDQVRVVHVVGRGEADAAADADAVLVGREGALEAFDHAARQRIAVFVIARQDRQLVAAEAEDQIVRIAAGPQPVRDLDEQRVADRMAERVVHRLEAIEVDHHDGGRLGRIEARLQLVLEAAAVRQSGQRVVIGHVRDRGLNLPGLGHVVIGQDRATVGHRAAGDTDDPAVGEVVFDPGDGGAAHPDGVIVDHPIDPCRVPARLVAEIVEEGRQGQPRAQFVRADAEQLIGALVVQRDDPVRADHDEAVRHVLERRRQDAQMLRRVGGGRPRGGVQLFAVHGQDEGGDEDHQRGEGDEGRQRHRFDDPDLGGRGGAEGQARNRDEMQEADA